jgi:hypothetical protein
MNRGGLANVMLGGWKLSMSENTNSGAPISISYAGSPNRYLTAARVNPTTTVEQAKVQNWDMGQRFPTAAQTPYININSFAYPAAYSIGSLGSRVLQAPALLSLRVDGHNLPWKRPNLAAPNTSYNLNSANAFGRFTGVVGDFSNFGTAQANVQISIRAEF